MPSIQDIKRYLEDETKRRHVRVAAFGVLGFSAGGLIMFFLISTIGLTDLWQRAYQPSENIRSGEVATNTLPAAVPQHIRIPSLDITTTFEEPLGLNPDRTIEVPEGYEEVGWYRHGPTPGELGPAVVLGHVDSRDGPAIFYSLGQLAAGDSVFIDREDGTTAEFRVTELARYEQEGFPRELVYGDIDHAGLRLVTCSGDYDRNTDRYSHNLVVYAELVGATSSPSTVTGEQE